MPDDTAPPTLLNTEEAARYLGVSVWTLMAARLATPRCDGPPYLRVGRRNGVKYRLADLDAYLDSRRVVPAAMGVRR